ncbi:MAG TPA: glutaminase [Bacteroidales bacterium]|nr:glutaminase [Bacteroidales bacterium]
MRKYQEIIEDIYNEIKPLTKHGKVADYIPALERVNRNKFGISVSTITGETYSVGDAEEKFSIQSIAKVFSLSMAMANQNEKIWERIDREPSGNAFNSLVQLEYENGIPRNPFVNAGALVVTDILISILNNAYTDLLDFVHNLCISGDIYYNEEVAQSEKETGFTNAAMVNFLRSHNNIENDVNQVLDVYFHHCSIDMTLKELSGSFLYLANHGVVPFSNRRILSQSQAKRINALMLTCGTYDEAGNFAYLAGIPAKSGVGGGIAAIIPNKLSIAVWGPALNEKGNSLAGVKALELFTTKTGMSIF